MEATGEIFLQPASSPAATAVGSTSPPPCHISQGETGAPYWRVLSRSRKEEGCGRLLFNGRGASVWDARRVLEMDGGDGCPVM